MLGDGQGTASARVLPGVEKGRAALSESHGPDGVELSRYSNPKSVVRLSMAETLGAVCALRWHTTRPI